MSTKVKVCAGLKRATNATSCKKTNRGKGTCAGLYPCEGTQCPNKWPSKRARRWTRGGARLTEHLANIPIIATTLNYNNSNQRLMCVHYSIQLRKAGYGPSLSRCFCCFSPPPTSHKSRQSRIWLQQKVSSLQQHCPQISPPDRSTLGIKEQKEK